MDYLPLNINVQGRPVLVVGGGDLALRKDIKPQWSGVNDSCPCGN
jgi:hypothetical protein